MAFKKAPPPTDVAASPDKLFLALPRRKIPDVLPHQREVLRRYSSEALNLSDVALQLPTGNAAAGAAERGLTTAVITRESG
jgi:hypothetical protein